MGGPGSGAKTTPAMAIRNADFESRYRAGETLEQIGQRYGVTRERVRQVIERRGVTFKDGGAHLTAKRNRVCAAAKRDERFLAKKGCTYAQWRMLADMGKPTRAFAQQRKSADRRGIGWELTLWQWWIIWQKSGHWQERGRGQGYVMCRKGDLGPYAIGNVFIAKAIENSSNKRTKKYALPIGVTQKRYGFAANRMIDGKKIYLGQFKTPDLAHAAYLAASPTHSEAA